MIEDLSHSVGGRLRTPWTWRRVSAGDRRPASKVIRPRTVPAAIAVDHAEPAAVGAVTSRPSSALSLIAAPPGPGPTAVPTATATHRPRRELSSRCERTGCRPTQSRRPEEHVTRGPSEWKERCGEPTHYVQDEKERQHEHHGAAATMIPSTMDLCPRRHRVTGAVAELAPFIQCSAPPIPPSPPPTEIQPAAGPGETIPRRSRRHPATRPTRSIRPSPSTSPAESAAPAVTASRTPSRGW